jgi:hypothetical protein
MSQRGCTYYFRQLACCRFNNLAEHREPRAARVVLVAQPARLRLLLRFRQDERAYEELPCTSQEVTQLPEEFVARS